MIKRSQPNQRFATVYYTTVQYTKSKGVRIMGPGKLMLNSQPKQSIVAVDVKHILDQIDKILGIQKTIVESLLNQPTMVSIDPKVFGDTFKP